MAKLCIALGLCAAAAFFSLSQFATRRGRQGDDVKALCSWLISASVPERVRQWALTSPLLNCAALLSQQQVASATPTIATPLENQYRKAFPASTILSTESWSLEYDEFTSTTLQEEPEQEITTTLSSAPPVTTLRNEEATESEASTKFLMDSWPTDDDASTPTYTSQISSHIEEYQTGWSGKATYSEDLLSVQRKQDTVTSLNDNLLSLNQDSRTAAYLSVAEKNVKPKEVMTPKPAFIADQQQDRQATPTPEPTLPSLNYLDREITTIPFSSLSPTPQQRQTMNVKPVTQFGVKSEEKAKISADSFLLQATGEDSTTELETPETTQSDFEKQEALSTIFTLPTVLRHAEKQQFSKSTTALESGMEEYENTTSLPSVPPLTLSKLERDADLSISTFDVLLQHSIEVPGASQASTNLDVQTENQTTGAPPSRSTVSEAHAEDVPTPDPASEIPSQQPENDSSLPYIFVQRHDQQGTNELSSFLPIYTSTVANLNTPLSATPEVVPQSENTHASHPLPDSPTTPNDMHRATITALDTPTLASFLEEVETMKSATEKLTFEHQEEATHASEPLFEHSSSVNKQDSTTSSIIASPLKVVELSTTTEPTPEEPEGPKVVCYFPAWSFFRGGRGHYTPEDIDPQLCTHVIYAWASLDNDSLHIASADYNADIKYNLYNRTLALKAVNRRLKVLLSLGGRGSSEDTYSTLAANSTARRSFARHAATFVAEHRFDGLDVDWEYPSCVGDDCRDNMPDKRNFVLLLQDIREAFDAFNPPLLLTAAISGNVQVIRKAYHVAEMFNQTDFISVMAYDYFGTQNPVVAHYSPLQSATDETNPEMSIEYVVSTLMAMGAPAEKLVLGVPFYARSYTLANPRLNYIGAPARGKGEPGPVTATPGTLAYYEICSAIKAGGWTTMMDPRAGVYAYAGDQWVCFDGPRSLMRKARFALDAGLAGLMAWDLSMDDFRGECGRKIPLLNAIHRVFYPPKTAAIARGSG
ncbi:uncharacterized protein [Dermacentor andersoni]|uniref:uncharacterized protein n=1 Tax=Dermacentor andersoni TaxID=34620 RepID=UPI0021559DBC|nr:mucin-2-like [Dermacentor andersoni]